MDRSRRSERNSERKKERQRRKKERKKHIIYIHIIYGDQVDRWTNR